MRSAAYSLFATILLLVPIAALPLMAIFGVPQFTPVVVSPMDEPATEEWGRPEKSRPRSAPRSRRTDEPEFEPLEDQTLSWEETPPRPSRLERRTKSRERPDPFRKSEPDQSSMAAAPRSRQQSAEPRKRPSAVEEFSEEASAMNSRVQPVNYEEPAEEDSPSVAPEDTEPRSIQAVFGEQAEIPEAIPADEQAGYRRQRSAVAPSTDRAPVLKPKAFLRGGRVSSTPESPTWADAVRRLNELGIRNFRLEPGSRPNEFVFTCSVTPGNSPRVTRMFEAEADDPLKAVAKVLAQVEEWAEREAAPGRGAEKSADLDLSE